MLKKWTSESDENRKELEAYTQLWQKSKDLVLSDAIDVESSLHKTKKRIFGIKKVRALSSLIRQAAAVLILAVLLSVSYNYFTNKVQHDTPEQIVYQEIKASYGTQTKVVLCDGTNVWLNSGSTLRFPTSFKNSTKREIYLNGEGFFDVRKNETKPFIVNTSKLNVKVYGTSFNVSAYEDYKTMTVALVEGKVSLLKNSGNLMRELIVLKPNEVIDYDTDSKKLYHSTDNYMEKYTAWKDGQIVFYGDSIDVVIKRLEKWYNVKINVSDERLNRYKFTATFIDESLEQVLNLLCLSSQMKYKITPAQKLKDNSYTQREVTLSIKK